LDNLRGSEDRLAGVQRPLSRLRREVASIGSRRFRGRLTRTSRKCERPIAARTKRIGWCLGSPCCWIPRRHPVRVDAGRRMAFLFFGSRSWFAVTPRPRAALRPLRAMATRAGVA